MKGYLFFESLNARKSVKVYTSILYHNMSVGSRHRIYNTIDLGAYSLTRSYNKNLISLKARLIPRFSHFKKYLIIDDRTLVKNFRSNVINFFKNTKIRIFILRYRFLQYKMIIYHIIKSKYPISCKTLLFLKIFEDLCLA